jgi:hypothetical protein
MWEILYHLKNLQLLKSKVDLLEPSDLKDQLLLEIERHKNSQSIFELIQILGNSEQDQSECGKAHSKVRRPDRQTRGGGHSTDRQFGSHRSQTPKEGRGPSIDEQLLELVEEDSYI